MFSPRRGGGPRGKAILALVLGLTLAYTGVAAAPRVLAGTATPMAVIGGDSHSCALLSDGTVDCWGHNQYGVLGDGTTDDSLTPIPVTGISTATAISVGYVV